MVVNSHFPCLCHRHHYYIFFKRNTVTHCIVLSLYSTITIPCTGHKNVPLYFRLQLCHSLSDSYAFCTSKNVDEYSTTDFRRSTLGRWAFSVARPTVWNLLPPLQKYPMVFSHKNSMEFPWNFHGIFISFCPHEITMVFTS